MTNKYDRAERAYERLVERSERLGIPAPSEEVVIGMLAKATRCEYCDRRLIRTDPEPYGKRPTMEHRLPLALGGSNDRGNLAVSCVRCNILKGTATASAYCALIEGKSEKILDEFFIESRLGILAGERAEEARRIEEERERDERERREDSAERQCPVCKRTVHMTYASLQYFQSAHVEKCDGSGRMFL